MSYFHQKHARPSCLILSSTAAMYKTPEKTPNKPRAAETGGKLKKARGMIAATKNAAVMMAIARGDFNMLYPKD